MDCSTKCEHQNLFINEVMVGVFDNTNLKICILANHL